MAFASKTPTQIGRIRWPSSSRRTMIGMFVIGSIMSPLMVIWICMPPPPVGRSEYRDSGSRCQRIRTDRDSREGVWPAARDPHADELTDERARAIEVDDAEMA